MTTYEWIESDVPSDLEVRQVYGFIFNLDGRILLLEDEGQFNLPGGKPERDESLRETLRRESLEEGQLTINSLVYLGYQLIVDVERYAQVRMAGLIENIFPSTPDLSNKRQYSRLWVPPVQLNGLLKWGESGRQQVTKAIATGSELGVFWDGTPLAYIETD